MTAFQTRKLGPFQVAPIGFGCMTLSHAYGDRPDRATAEAVLHRALDLGYNLIDTAALYGLGANEILVGETLKARRGEFVLASKCGLRAVDGKRVIDGTPEGIRTVCEESLRRLQTEVIDLYYLHRRDPRTPIEDSIGALSRLVEEGKVRSVGLSEMSAETLRKAHAVHPITAMQSEYSLMTRNPEIAVLQACKELGTAFVAFSPISRGFLSGKMRDPERMEAGDLRRTIPRFQAENYAHNLKLLEPLGEIAGSLGCTRAQAALAWLLHQGEHVIALPGTTKADHLAEDFAAARIRLDGETLARLGAAINNETVRGNRLTAINSLDVDTEEFPA
jgi:aryl-alcohol dehydrogenase-like predicted oxidoreductase